ncbi:hypothetical protein [uncultured Vibrio sp.]|uniref:hypothetical protein n=1 Tax=uncultured Vibrio sp. TaxID=114054 RepID=UPI000921DC01|nr:hypothetical protein [uncultured Vibrio sp.]OIQ26533.1 MAG: hypothetical protein BM561_01920 [Vibrio sp. MedPE-SWchi]
MNQLSKKVLILAASFLLGCQSTSNTGFVIPPNGGAAVSAGQGWWFSGIEEVGMENHTASYPKRAISQHMEIVNAGYYVADAYGQVSQIIYRYNIDFKSLPNSKLYTKAILQNPLNRRDPIIYQHYILQEEKSTQVTHGPLNNVVNGQLYDFRFEIYNDEAMTDLVDSISQKVRSPLDNTSGCVEIEPDYKNVYMGNIKDPNGRIIPLDKLMLSCVK